MSNFYYILCSLTNEAKDVLRERIEAVIPYTDTYKAQSAKTYTEKDMSALGQIVRATFPSEILDAARATTRGEYLNPLVIHNIPEFENLQRPKNYMTPMTKVSMFPYIAAGIFHEAGLPFEYTNGNFADISNNNPNNRFAPGDLNWHTDFPLDSSAGTLTCIRNHEHARTSFVNDRAVYDALTPEEKKQILLSDQEHSLHDVLEAGLRMLTDPKRGTPPQITDKLNQLIKEHSVEIDLQPGVMVLWNQDHLLHRVLSPVNRMPNREDARWSIAAFAGRDGLEPSRR